MLGSDRVVLTVLVAGRYYVPVLSVRQLSMCSGSRGNLVWESFVAQVAACFVWPCCDFISRCSALSDPFRRGRRPAAMGESWRWGGRVARRRQPARPSDHVRRSGTVVSPPTCAARHRAGAGLCSPRGAGTAGSRCSRLTSLPAPGTSLRGAGTAGSRCSRLTSLPARGGYMPARAAAASAELALLIAQRREQPIE